jgi:hypothetical protein
MTNFNPVSLMADFEELKTWVEKFNLAALEARLSTIENAIVQIEQKLAPLLKLVEGEIAGHGLATSGVVQGADVGSHNPPAPANPNA